MKIKIIHFRSVLPFREDRAFLFYLIFVYRKRSNSKKINNNEIKLKINCILIPIFTIIWG